MAQSLCLLLIVLLTTPALARHGTPDGRPPSRESVCDHLSGAAFGLCNAYCEAQDCDVAPKSSCEQLRDNFEKHTGSRTFPCDGQALPTATRTATASPGESTPTFTPTDTPSPATATATATQTETFDDVRPTGLVSTATPTHTLGVPTGTATATMPPDACAGLQGAAFGLCNAYCNAQDCPANPVQPSCDELRENFEAQTGSPIFPCDLSTPGGECMCDCAGDGKVTIDDLTNVLLITLGHRGMDGCPHLIGRIDHLAISHLIAAVIDALNGCP